MPVDYRRRHAAARSSYTRTNEKRFADLDPGTLILIPSPSDIDEEARLLGTHETITFTELRDRLAVRHDAHGSCPVMTGMNLRTAAEVVLADLAEGVPVEEVPPVWKVVDPDGPLAQKLPGGAARIGALRDRLGAWAGADGSSSASSP